MKKFFLFLVVVIYFTNLSFGRVIEQNQNAKIANMVVHTTEINGLQNPNLIFPDQMLILPYPQPEDRWMVSVRKGECLWSISKDLLYPKFKGTPYIYDNPVQKVVPNMNQKANNDFTAFWLHLSLGWWLLIILGILYLLGFIFLGFFELKKRKERN